MRVPFFIIAPVIVIICTVGAYSVSNSYLDVMLMMGFGVLGYLFKKLHYPLAPLVLAIDWIATTKSSLLPPDHALFMLLATPRRARWNPQKQNTSI